MTMNFREYLKWWQEHKNYEEKLAPQVVEEICHAHELEKEKIQLFPRKFLETEQGRMEFDLVIAFSDKWKSRLIGIEFKEFDFREVITQAILRRDYVDYMYIATKPFVASHELSSFFIMLLYGIGWVIWGEKEAHLIFKSRYHYPPEERLHELINVLVREKLRTSLSNLSEDKIVTLEKWIKESEK